MQVIELLNELLRKVTTLFSNPQAFPGISLFFLGGVLKKLLDMENISEK